MVVVDIDKSLENSTLDNLEIFTDIIELKDSLLMFILSFDEIYYTKKTEVSSDFPELVDACDKLGIDLKLYESAVEPTTDSAAEPIIEPVIEPTVELTKIAEPTSFFDESDIEPPEPTTFFSEPSATTEETLTSQEVATELPIKESLTSQKDAKNEVLKKPNLLDRLFHRKKTKEELTLSENLTHIASYFLEPPRNYETYIVGSGYMTLEDMDECLQEFQAVANNPKKFVETLRMNGKLSEDESADVLSKLLKRQIISKNTFPIESYPDCPTNRSSYVDYVIIKIDKKSAQLIIGKDADTELNIDKIKIAHSVYDIVVYDFVDGVTQDIKNELHNIF